MSLYLTIVNYFAIFSLFLIEFLFRKSEFVSQLRAFAVMSLYLTILNNLTILSLIAIKFLFSNEFVFCNF